MNFKPPFLVSKKLILLVYSLTLLLLGFFTQIYVSRNYGLEILGITVLIRTLNSETFIYFIDFGIGEEILFEKEVNKKSFYLRVFISFIILVIISLFVEILNDHFRIYRYLILLMMWSNYLLFLTKLIYKKQNKINVIRHMDILISLVFLIVIIFTSKTSIILYYLIATNFFLVLRYFEVRSIKVFNLTNCHFKVINSLIYYSSTLSSKLEGSLLSFVIPASASLDSLGRYDLITKIPKAFKSQLGEYNSLAKFDYLFNRGNNNKTHIKIETNNLIIYTLFFVCLAITLAYLYLMKIDLTLLIFVFILSELSIGFFFNKFNIRLVELLINPMTRLKYVSISLLRSLIFFTLVLNLKFFQGLNEILCLWYLLYFLFFLLLYLIFLKKR